MPSSTSFPTQVVAAPRPHSGQSSLVPSIHFFITAEGKKGEDQGKYVTFSTMMHKEASESLEMTEHHVPLSQMID